jgi:hypothetical protein
MDQLMAQACALDCFRRNQHSVMGLCHVNSPSAEEMEQQYPSPPFA